MQLSTEWSTDRDLEDERQMQADRRSEFELSEKSRRRRAFDVFRNFRNEEVSCVRFNSHCATDANPLNKVVQLLSDFETKTQEA